MKICCISDTHCQLNQIKVPDGDMLIHSGDLTYHGSVQEMTKELILLGKFPHKYKIFICGNHDFLGEKNPTLTKQICEDNGIIYLDDSGTTIEGLNIHGSAVSPFFFAWAFNRYRGADIKKHWDMIPNNTDILITHTPPYGFLDAVRHEHVGCEDLLKTLMQVKPKLHTFGHIHESYGQDNHGNIKMVNASICNGRYDPINKPIVVEI